LNRLRAGCAGVPPADAVLGARASRPHAASWRVTGARASRPQTRCWVCGRRARMPHRDVSLARRHDARRRCARCAGVAPACRIVTCHRSAGVSPADAVLGVWASRSHRDASPERGHDAL